MSEASPSPPDHDGWSAHRRELVRRTEEELVFGGYSPRTRETYATHVRRFLESVEATDGPPGEAALRSYVVRRLERDGWSRAYVFQCMSALKFFYRRVCPGVVDVDALPSFRRAKKLPEVLTRREVEADSRWIFPGQRPGRHLSTRTAQRVFARTRDAAGIDRDVGIHVLQHSFATHLLEAGTGLRYIQELPEVRPETSVRRVTSAAGLGCEARGRRRCRRYRRVAPQRRRRARAVVTRRAPGGSGRRLRPGRPRRAST